MKHVVRSVISHFAAVAIFASAGYAHAELLVYESFEQSAPGALNAQTSGDGFAGAYSDNGTCSVVVESANRMVYQNGDISIDGGTTHMRMQLKSAISKGAVLWGRAIDTITATENNDPIYISLLMRVSPSCAADDDEDSFLFGITTEISKAPIYGVNFAKSSEGSGNAIGMREYNTNMLGSTKVIAGQTYLVVYKWYKKNGYYRGFSMVLNPSSSEEPSTWDIDVDSGLNKRLAEYLAISCFVRESCETEDQFDIDEFRIGRSWSDVTGAATYNGVVPRPEISVEGGETTRTVTISHGMTGVSCYYTLDGTTPSASNGTLYSSPFVLTDSADVRAVAVDSYGNASEVVIQTVNFELHWVGASGDDSWTTTVNWLPNGNPVNKALVFGAEDRTKDSIVNSVISQDTTVRSLLFTNNSFAPAVVTPNYYWHVISIGEGKTLTVNGRDENGYVFRMWSPTTTGEPSMAAKFTGGGRLVVNSPEADVLTQFNSSNNKATTTLNLAGLSEFDCTASVFTFCRGRRAKGTLALAKTGIGKNTFTLDAFYLADMRSDDQGGDTVSMQLGSDNVFNSDIFYIGAPSAGYNHAQPAAVSFASGLTNPTVKIRAKDGLGRADMKVGSHGTNVDATPRSMNVTADFSAGSVDAKVGDFVVGNGRGYFWSNQYGTLSATFKMSAGTFDTLSTVVGRTEYTSGTRNVNARPCTGTFSLSGGDFIAQGNFYAAENSAEAYQGARANISVSGGTLDIGGNMSLAARHGCATNVVAALEVSGGILSVKGALTGGEDDQHYTGTYTAEDVNVQANVTAAGGVIAVTNEQGTAELRIESGTLALQGGKVYADSLVLTNAASAMEVLLSGDGFATVEAGTARLGGTIKVSIADGFDPHGASEWTIVDGTLPRVGVFAAVELPEGYKVKYTPTGFMVANKSGLTIIVR